MAHDGHLQKPFPNMQHHAQGLPDRSHGDDRLQTRAVQTLPPPPSLLPFAGDMVFEESHAPVSSFSDLDDLDLWLLDPASPRSTRSPDQSAMHARHTAMSLAAYCPRLRHAALDLRRTRTCTPHHSTPRHTSACTLHRTAYLSLSTPNPNPIPGAITPVTLCARTRGIAAMLR